MTESEIRCVKDCVDKYVEIETEDGELIVAKIVSVFDDAALDEHELFCEVVSSNMRESHEGSDVAEGYAVDFSNILSAKPHPIENR